MNGRVRSLRRRRVRRRGRCRRRLRCRLRGRDRDRGLGSGLGLGLGLGRRRLRGRLPALPPRRLAERADRVLDHLRRRLVPLAPRETRDAAAELRDRDRLAEAHLEIGGARHALAGGEGVEGAGQVDGQHVHVALEREVPSGGEERLQLPVSAARALREDEEVIPAAERLGGRLEARLERALALHRDEVREVLEVGALHARVEEVVARGERREAPPLLAERDLHEPHVEVARVVRDDEHVPVVRDVGDADDLRVVEPVVERALPEPEQPPPEPRDRGRDRDLLVAGGHGRRGPLRLGRVPARRGGDHARELARRLHVLQMPRDRRGHPRLLERGGELREHQAVEAEIGREARLVRHLGARPAGHLGEQVEEPAVARAVLDRGLPRPPSLLRGGLEPEQLLAHEAALHLARRGLRQLAVVDVPHLHALRERERRGDRAHVRLEPRAHLVAIVLAVLGHDDEGDLLPRAVGQPDHAELLHELRIAVRLLDLVGVDVLAVGIDDDVLLAADEREVPLRVELPEIAGLEPPAVEHLGGLLRVHAGALPAAPVAEHHVRPAREDLPDAVRVRVRDPELHPGQRRPDAPLRRGLVRLRHRQHRRGLGEAVPLEQIEAELPERLLDLGIERGAAGD